MLPSKINLTTASSTGSIDLLLIPATLTGDIKLSLTVNGITFGATLASSSFGGKLEAGKQYNASITLKPTALEVTSVTINDWNDETVSGEYEPVFVPEPIDIGLDFLIAWGNLRAIKPAGSSTYKYFFAKEQGYYSGVNDAPYDPAGGDYFAWNTLEPNKEYRGGSTIGVWDEAYDPCRKIDGGEWYTPTYAQCEAMAAAESIWGTYTMRNSKKVYGRYLGTKDDPGQAEQDTYLFLPAAGSVYSNSYRNAGDIGYFLSASIYPDQSGYQDAYGYLSIDSYNVPSFLFADLTTMIPVRCVKDKPLPEHAIEVEGLDFYVADGNVRAISNGAGGYTYQFADEQGYCSGVNGPYNATLGGDYFCWNTLDPSVTNAKQTEWDDARDPCRQIGDGKWYTPTQAQLQKLVELYTNKKAVWGTYEMSSGPKDGMYFGTATAPTTKADQDKYVFLPAAGNRYVTNWGGVGIWGYYRSSTPIGIYVYALVLASDSCFVGGNNDYNGRRDDGFSVRCVRNK